MKTRNRINHRINHRIIATLVALVLLVGVAGSQVKGQVVNINTASEEQLTLLPRVGPSLAKRIIEFRDSNGRFKTSEDLMLVRGIGEATFQLLEPYVSTDGETTLSEPVSSASKAG